jgi:NaMN:DMB phosphoribosyltransferase
VLGAGVAPQPGAERPAGVVRTGLRPSRNLAVEAALDDDQLDVALATGRRMANDARARGANVLLGGDMGVAHTTPSARLAAWLTGRGAAEVCGQGTGVDDPGLARKRAMGRSRRTGCCSITLASSCCSTCACASGKPALEIRRDPRVGTFGALALGSP